MHRTLLRRKPARILAGVLAVTLVTSQIAMADPTIGNTQVVVNDVKGAMGAQEQVLHAGVDVFPNEVIKTGPKSASRVVFQDKTNLEVGASSQVTLDRFVFDPDPAKSSVALSIARGTVRFATGNLPKASYKLTTPTATIGVRGTIFTITVADDGTTTITVEEGTAIVQSGGQTVEVNAGQSTTVSSSGTPPTPPQAAPPAPPVGEMDYLLADNPGLPAGTAAGAGHVFVLGALPVGLTIATVAAIIVVVAVASESSNGTH